MSNLSFDLHHVVEGRFRLKARLASHTCKSSANLDHFCKNV
jgi:hypothetical protein